MIGDLPSFEYLLAIGLALFLGIGIHEYAHCKIADMAGDPTPGIYGRVTLNLTKHFEPTGVFMMVFTVLSGYGIGWGKPAPCNDSKMKNPRWDGFACAAGGPASNILQACFYAMILRLVALAGIPLANLGWFAIFLFIAIIINIRLALFNLIPFGLLDGHWLVGYMLPEKQRFYWFKMNRSRTGIFLLIGLILVSQYMERNLGWSPLTYLIDIPGDHIISFLLGDLAQQL